MQYLFQNLLNLRRVVVHNRLNSDDIWAYIEKCYRHYSKTYHVSLLEAKEKLTIEEVVMIHMEDEIEEMSVEDVMEMLKTIDNAEKPIALCDVSEEPEQEVSDEEWIAQQNITLKKQDEEKKRKQAEEIAKKTHEAIEQLTGSFKEMTKKIDPPKPKHLLDDEE